MSTPEVPTAASSLQPVADDPALSQAQHNDLLASQAVTFRIERDEANVRLLQTRIYHQFEAQSRQILQRGLESLQHSFFHNSEEYKNIYSGLSKDKSRLREELKAADEVISSQKQLIEMYQASYQPYRAPVHYQNHNPNHHLLEDVQLLSQYDTCQSPSPQASNLGLLTKTARLGQANDLRYGAGSSLEPSCGPNEPTPHLPPDSQESSIRDQE